MAILPTVDNLRAVTQKVFFVPIVYGFISLLPMFLSGWENSDRLTDRLFSVIRSKENTFDFVIVGGGTAGALVASRLAEHYKVLLLEAGGTPNPFQTIPALSLKLLNLPQTDWSYKTVPQRKACLNSVNQQSSWSSGKGLGGTTNINFMAHTRGHPMDYDNWAEIIGDSSWRYSAVLPYFKKSETFSGTSNDPEARGHNGELRIRKPSYIGLSEDWVRAGQELTYPFVDLNGNYEEGFGIIQYPIFKGIRQTTYSAFLLPMHKSPRLTIRRYATVRKILFRDMNNMAYGVEYVRHGRIETAIATKEVILSAGTLGSAKLLMLSGVGPKGHLEELGIPVRSDLPVGKNLQDHLGVHLGPFFITEPKSFLFDRDVTPENIVRWLFLGTGPLTTTGYQGAASIASSFAKSRGEGNWPDLHLILHGQAIHKGYADAFAYAYSLQEDDLRQYYTNAFGRDSFHITVIGSRPASTGQVLLTGASISDPLVINPGYLEDGGDADYKVLLEGVKTALNIANSSVFLRLGTEFTSSKLAGCDDHRHGSDKYWECYIRRYTLSMHNPVGTISLGSVVDSYLRVRKTRGLRVVDASIQPTIVSTGTAASTFMIAEKGVDMILKDYGIPERDVDLFDVVFGRNGFFKRNPILRILQREFDTLNPLRALFKPFTSTKDTELDAKERYTRNSALNNPVLQVISNLLGTTNDNKGEPSFSASENSNVDLSINKVADSPASLLLDRLSFPSNYERARKVENNRNWWELLISPTKAYIPPQPRPLPLHHFTSPKVIGLGVSEYKRLNIPDVPTVKGKGGRRYALLQALLKEAETNATASKLGKITYHPSRRFEKYENSENEIGYGKTSKLSGELVAKPISVNPYHLGILSVDTIPKSSADKFKPVKNAKPSPFDDLLKHIKTFEKFILSLTAKDKPRSWSSYSKFAKPQEISFTAAQSQNPFHSPANGNNIFSSLSALSSNVNNSTVTTTSPLNIGLGTRSASNGSTINPFKFLFDSPVKSTTTPESNDPFDLHLHDLNNNYNSNITNNTSLSSDADATSNNNYTRIDNSTTRSSSNDSANIFSSWFQPFSKSTSTSSWFRPFATDTNPSTQSTSSSSSWFEPINFSDKPNPLFKPLNDVTSWFKSTTPEKSSPPSSSSSFLSSWFKPLNSDSDTMSAAVAVTTQASLPPTSDPLADLFDVLFGGLGKRERQAIHQTLESMAGAGQNIVEVFGPPPNAKETSSHKKYETFYEQIAAGRPAAVLKQSKITAESYNDFYQSLVQLNAFFNQYSTTTTKPPPPTVTPLNTFEFQPSSSSPPSLNSSLPSKSSLT